MRYNCILNEIYFISHKEECHVEPLVVLTFLSKQHSLHSDHQRAAGQGHVSTANCVYDLMRADCVSIVFHCVKM